MTSVNLAFTEDVDAGNLTPTTPGDQFSSADSSTALWRSPLPDASIRPLKSSAPKPQSITSTALSPTCASLEQFTCLMTGSHTSLDHLATISSTAITYLDESVTSAPFHPYAQPDSPQYSKTSELEVDEPVLLDYHLCLGSSEPADPAPSSSERRKSLIVEGSPTPVDSRTALLIDDCVGRAIKEPALAG
ncbi:unnamed protein product [Protopolystoma xenopodis]|uniref:Uncharacterized protein n=1 Tax=Protopolystoma xenopodis TaxID=117903 RepID=A0A448WJ65_9PLAT|nr:unnamed protein product [Protopolystoma xenopodis]